MRIASTVVSLMLVAGSARGETIDAHVPIEVAPTAPTMIQTGAPLGGSLVKNALELHDEAGGIRATWTLQFASDAKAVTEVSIPLYVTPDVAVTGMSLWSLSQDPFFANGFVAEEAEHAYEKSVVRAKDPALLQCTTTCQSLRLRVFPVGRHMPAQVKIELWMPGGNRMTFDAGAHRDRKVHTFTGLPVEEPEAIRALSKDRALVAGPGL